MRQGITPRLWLRQPFAGLAVEMRLCMALEDSWI